MDSSPALDFSGLPLPQPRSRVPTGLLTDRGSRTFASDAWRSTTERCPIQVNVARDVAVQMCDTLEGKAYTGVVNVSYMAVANEVRGVFPRGVGTPWTGLTLSARHVAVLVGPGDHCRGVGNLYRGGGR